MRIYEFCKIHNLSAKAILESLQNAGFEVKNHMSVLTEDMTKLLGQIYLKKEAPKEVVGRNVTSENSDRLHKEIDSSNSSAKETKIMQKNHSYNKTNQAPFKKNVKTVSRQPSRETNLAKQAIAQQPVSLAPEEIVLESMSVVEAAHRIGKPVNDIILSLLRSGIVATKNHVLNESVVAKLAELYNIKTVKPSHSISHEGVTNLAQDAQRASGDLHERLPVVVVLGHVDHGKTSLLDFIRKTRVASREKGGITQHLGAYEATTKQGNIIFLDTPGHEAFSKIRQRGVRVADIAILVVAADDGIMPQTIEAIKQAKGMKVPIIVAVNKIDKVDSQRLEGIKRELAQHDLLPEEWGGSTIVVPISAKLGTGIDLLLDMIILQSQLMELRANMSGFSRGYILEAKIEKGRGAVATVICQSGRIAIGDYFICGNTFGRISVLVDSYGKKIDSSVPSSPVQVSGFQELPDVGDLFEVVSKEEYLQKKDILASNKQSVKRLIKEGFINIIVKSDTNASKEALIDSIEKVSKKSHTGYNVLFAGIGAVSESDIELAYNTGSIIVGLHVKVEPNAQTLAHQRDVTIELHDIIYKLLESLEARAEGTRKVEMVRSKIGEAVVRKVFDIKGIGIVAGSYVKDGRFTKEGTVVVWRGRQKVGEGKITSLQRDKKSVKEVHAGFECGFIIDGISDWQPDDRVECYIEVPANKKK